MKLVEDLQKLKAKYEKKIEVLEEKKCYAEGKNFEKIIDEIRELNYSILKINDCEEWLMLEQSGKYKIIYKLI